MEKADIDYTLYLCTDRSFMKTKTLEETVEQAVQGGCSIVQLREKDCSTKEFLEQALRIKKTTQQYNVPLIINDRIDICMAADADGVHLGQEDMPVAQARKLLGEGKIIGASAHNVEEALKAWQDGADYLGVGAIFGTNTKKNTVDTSIETLKEICVKVPIPVVAIGGVGLSNIEKLAGSQIRGVAVVSAIMAEEDPKKAAEKLVIKVREVQNERI
jgi:thiamine-phosphate pyrophosphorylase